MEDNLSTFSIKRMIINWVKIDKIRHKIRMIKRFKVFQKQWLVSKLIKHWNCCNIWNIDTKNILNCQLKILKMDSATSDCKTISIFNEPRPYNRNGLYIIILSFFEFWKFIL